MKVVIVNCFDTYENRVDLLVEYFKTSGYDVKVIQSDFRHFEKSKRIEKKENYIFINTLPYYKNLSLKRMNSHYQFAKNAFEVVDKLSPDLLYVLIPANSLAKFAYNYKKKNRNVKLYFDLIDLWPETMPIGKLKTFPPFRNWKLLRDDNLKGADYIISECNLYLEVLREKVSGIKVKSLYLAREKKQFVSRPSLSKERIELCYLGSINNIIDIDSIKKVLEQINYVKPVVLNIIGDGEKRNEFISEIQKVGVEVRYYGKIYYSNEKQEIFNRCHFGINMMKSSVCVGLTMKSIDYFEAGLPILNNIKGDTKELVNKYSIGFNIDDDDIQNVVNKVTRISKENLLLMRENTRKIFEELFTKEAFIKEMDCVIKDDFE